MDVKSPQQMLHALRDPAARRYLSITSVLVLILGVLALLAGGSGVKTRQADGAGSTQPGAAGSEASVDETASDGGAGPPGSSRAGSRARAKSGSRAASATGIELGRGVTQSTIRLGFMGIDEQDAEGVYKSIGAGGLRAGPQIKAAKAMVDYLNKNGGIAGRKIDPLYREIKTAERTRESEHCAFFAEDNKVFAVIYNNEAHEMPACLAKKDTVFLQEDTGVHDEVDFKNLAPYYYGPAWFDQTRNALIYVDGLVDQGFLKKETKIGLLLYDQPYYRRAADIVGKRLADYGMKVTERVAGAGLSDASWQGPAVVRFRTSFVTHVLILDFHIQMLGTFAPAAESQGYRPAYGLNSSSLWWDSAALNPVIPPEQLAGAVGVGHRPVDDVGSRDHNAAVKRCFEIFDKAGLEISGANAARYTLAYCDLLIFLKTGLEHAPALTADGLRKGVATFGESYESALNFGTRFGPGAGLGGPSQIRYGGYDSSCQCWKYTSGLIAAKHWG